MFGMFKSASLYYVTSNFYMIESSNEIFHPTTTLIHQTHLFHHQNFTFNATKSSTSSSHIELTNIEATTTISCKIIWLENGGKKTKLKKKCLKAKLRKKEKKKNRNGNENWIKRRMLALSQCLCIWNVVVVVVVAHVWFLRIFSSYNFHQQQHQQYIYNAFTPFISLSLTNYMCVCVLSARGTN